MINVLICCGGGFSSSFMVRRVQAGIIEQGLQDQMSVEFCQFRESKDKWDHIDVVFCCPHLSYKIPEYIKEFGSDIPYYVIPAQMYGMMTADDILEDAEDVLKGFEETGMNPYKFPGEENLHHSNRSHSYRKQGAR